MIHLVMMCVETSSFSVVINGNIYGFFPGKCRVRQGNPLSSYLFLICMKYLSRLLKITSQRTYFHFHQKCAFHGIYHLVFVDDILLLYWRDRSSVLILLEQLHVFGQTSRLHINAGKSFIYFGGVGDSMKQRILQDFSSSNTLESLSVLTGCWLASSLSSYIKLNLQYKAGWASIYPMLGGWN